MCKGEETRKWQNITVIPAAAAAMNIARRAAVGITMKIAVAATSTNIAKTVAVAAVTIMTMRKPVVAVAVMTTTTSRSGERAWFC